MADDIQTMPFGFPSADGTSTVHAVLWQSAAVAAGQPPRGVVQLIHGMAEHIGRYDGFARFLAAQGFAVCGHDHIGHGATAATPERFGLMPPEEGADIMVADAHCLRKRVTARFAQGTPWFMFGHSMGSLVLRCYLPRYGCGLAGAVICGTAMPPRLVSKAGNLLARAVVAWKGPDAKSPLLHRLADGAYSRAIPDAHTPFDWLSRDPAVVDAFIADEASGFMFSAGAYGVPQRAQRPADAGHGWRPRPGGRQRPRARAGGAAARAGRGAGRLARALRWHASRGAQRGGPRGGLRRYGQRGLASVHETGSIW